MNYVLGLGEVGREQGAPAGGKGANLGELTRVAGTRVPDGFCVTADAFTRAMDAVPSFGDLLDRLSLLDPDDRDGIRVASGTLRDSIEDHGVPDDVAGAVLAALGGFGGDAAFAVRSSATAEDLPTASFAGQQDSYLNVSGRDQILRCVTRCWASLFTERAVAYRMRNGFDHRQVRMAVVVQKMVFPDAAGVMFTGDQVTSDRTVVSVEAVFGLGEALVSGSMNPDVYSVRAARHPVDLGRLAHSRERDGRLRRDHARGRQALGADDRQQRQLPLRRTAGPGSQPQQSLTTVLTEQRVAVQLDHADRRVDEPLGGVPAQCDVALGPQRGEFLATTSQLRDHVVDFRVVTTGSDGAQVCHEVTGVAGVVLYRIQAARLRPGEPYVHEAAAVRACPDFRKWAEESRAEPVLRQWLVEVRHDPRGGVLEPVEQREQRRMHMTQWAAWRWRRVTGKVEEVVAFVAAQPQCPGQGREHLIGRTCAAAALEFGVVVRRRAGQVGDFFSSQPGHPAARPGGQADITGPDAVTAGLEEGTEVYEVHFFMFVPCGGANKGMPPPG